MSEAVPSPLLPPASAIPGDGVLLHIGVHKTGTTAIQAALADARPDLLAHGVRYPGKLQAQHRAALALLGRPWGWNSRGGSVMDRRHFDALVRRSTKHDGRVVISSEFFCEAPEDKARETVEALGGSEKVTVVVTLRNLGKLLPSSWQQYLKYGLTTSYEKWLEDDRFVEQFGIDAKRCGGCPGSTGRKGTQGLFPFLVQCVLGRLGVRRASPLIAPRWLAR